jgi:ATP-dependent helicase/nuclease subunit B
MNLIGEFRQSEFTPILFEEKIFHSEDIRLDSHDVSEMLTVNLSGVVDRADMYRVGDDVYLRVVDYKTGSKRFSMAEVEMGFQLQLLVYLFALTQGASADIKKKLDCKGELLPAGALYFSLGAKAVSCTKMPEDEALSRALIEKEIKRSGIFLNLPDVLEAMEAGLAGYYIPITLTKAGQPTKGRTSSELATLEEMGALANKVSDILRSIAKSMANGDAAAKPKSADKGKDTCQYCKMKPICRVRHLAEAEEGGES